MAGRATDEEKRTQLMDEVRETYENLKFKNAEMQNAINYLRKENMAYKNKYKELRTRLTNLTDLLERSTKVFNELFDDTKSALQMSRISVLSSPPLERQDLVTLTKQTTAGRTLLSVAENEIKKTKLSTKDVHVQYPKPSQYLKPVAEFSRGPVVESNIVLKTATRRKIHIEPLNMQELGQEINEPENAEISESHLLNGTPERLSTISEENSSRELCVNLRRLPSRVIDRHLSKQNSTLINSTLPLSDNSSLNVSETSLLPDFSSTPHKLEIMGKLGLCPKVYSNGDNFISVRKKDSGSTGNKSNVSSNTIGSPKKERRSCDATKNGITYREKKSYNRRADHRNGFVSPKKARLNSPEKKKVNSSEKERMNSPKKQKLSSPEKENVNYSKKQKPNSTKRERMNSPKKEKLSSPEEETVNYSKRQKKERMNSPNKERMNSPKQQKLSSPENENYSKKQKPDSPKKERMSSPKKLNSLEKEKVNSPKKDKMNSPKKERMSSKESMFSPARYSPRPIKTRTSSPLKDSILLRKRHLLGSPSLKLGRPSRKAKPTFLKEESLKNKKRRMN